MVKRSAFSTSAAKKVGLLGLAAGGIHGITHPDKDGVLPAIARDAAATGAIGALTAGLAVGYGKQAVIRYLKKLTEKLEGKK